MLRSLLEECYSHSIVNKKLNILFCSVFFPYILLDASITTITNNRLSLLVIARRCLIVHDRHQVAESWSSAIQMRAV